jgi:hypothetical protein
VPTHFSEHLKMVLKRMFLEFSWGRDLTFSTVIALLTLFIQFKFIPSISRHDRGILVLSTVAPYVLVFGAHLIWRGIRAPWQVYRKAEDSFTAEKKERELARCRLQSELEDSEKRLAKALAEPLGPELMLEFQQPLSIDPGALLVRNLRGGVAYDVTVHRSNHQGLELVERDFTYIPEGQCVAWEPTIYCPRFPEERFTFRAFLTPRPRSEEDKSKGHIPITITYRDANKKEFMEAFEIIVDYATWKLNARLLSREVKV